MSKVMVTPARIRSILTSCRTEKDVEKAFRAHGIRYSYDTAAGFLAFRVPARSGSVRVYRAASRSAPFLVSSVPPAPVYPVPVYHPEY